MWIQKVINLSAKPRGFWLVTDEVVKGVPELGFVSVGLLHLFIQHTSASLAINENADPDVRIDLESHFNQAVPENEPYYKHVMEGEDDMPAHIKSVLLGESLTIPLSNGKLHLGLWQGIYLCEHRNSAGGRKVVVTINGE